jgi:hypothetical protein
MWAGDGDGESAKSWYAVLTDLKSRGVRDVFFVVCDGLKGLPDSVNAVFPAAIVQTCIIHLVRGTFRYASRKYWDELAKDLKPIYQAPTAGAAAEALDALEEKWGTRYPAIIRLWRGAWTEFVPFLDYDLEIRFGHLLDQRHRVAQCPLPACGAGPGAFPQRAVRDEDAVSGRAIAGPQGHRADTMGHAAEAGAERLRVSPSPIACRRRKTTENETASYTVRATVPPSARQRTFMRVDLS